MISGRAEGQWRSEIAEEGLWEVFNAIFKLRSCPLSMQSYILQQWIRRII